MKWEDRMRLVAMSVSIVVGLLVGATGAQAHDDDHGWKRKHRHHYSPVYVVRERPVYYYSEPRVVYAPAPMYYPPQPPSLNINIPLR
jgi:hypothetical protein